MIFDGIYDALLIEIYFLTSKFFIMKCFKSFFFSIFILASSCSFAQIENTPAETLETLTEYAKDNAEHVNEISKSIFQHLDPAIQEAYDLSKIIENSSKLTVDEHRLIYEKLSRINAVYQSLKNDREFWKRELQQSLEDSKEIIRSSKIEAEKYANQSKKLKARLEQAKRSGDAIESQLKTMEMSVKLSITRQRIFDNFTEALENAKIDHKHVNKKIEQFLNVISEGAIATSIMLELTEISIKKNQIISNLEGLEQLDKYIEDINKSLQNLGKSLIELESIKDNA